MSLYFRFLWILLRSRLGQRVSPWCTWKTPFRVLPNDLDVLGHMNNGRYLTILDLARMDLMLRSGAWKTLKRQGWYPVVAGQTIAYRRSLHPWMRYDVHTRLVGVSEHGTLLEQTFCVGDDVYAQAFIRARFLRKSGGKVTEQELLGVFGAQPDTFDIPQWLSEWAEMNRQVPKTLGP